MVFFVNIFSLTLSRMEIGNSITVSMFVPQATTKVQDHDEGQDFYKKSYIIIKQVLNSDKAFKMKE